MSGTVTAAVAAVASVGIAAYSASQMGSVPGFVKGMAGTTFGEQQQYAQSLYDLINNPSSITKTPGYEFNLNQGLDAVKRKDASGGFFGSGQGAIDLNNYAEGFALNSLNQQENLYASLSGLQTATSPNSYAQTGIAAGNSSFNQWGQVLGSLGYLSKSGAFGSMGQGPSASTLDTSAEYNALAGMNYDTFSTPWMVSTTDVVG